MLSFHNKAFDFSRGLFTNVSSQRTNLEPDHASGLSIQLKVSHPGFDLDVDLSMPPAAVTVLFGPSGCGKTTILRCVAGLHQQMQGKVQIGDQVWFDSSNSVNIPTWQRELGYVFQEASLFGHLNVQKNLTFGVNRTTSIKTGSIANRESARQTLEQAIELLGIAHLLSRYPQQLSGGERQRVAIARALATQPALLLMDEPLAALDAARREEILPWLDRLRNDLRIPMIYVTHAREEVIRLADWVVLLDHGKVRGAGDIHQVFSGQLATNGTLTQAASVIDATVRQIDERWHLACIDWSGTQIWIRDEGLALGQTLRLQILASDVSIARSRAADSSIQNLLPATIDRIETDTNPAYSHVHLKCTGGCLLARITRKAVSDLQLCKGQPVWAQIKATSLVRAG